MLDDEMIDLAIVPFDASKASPEEWRMLHAFNKMRHNETQPNIPMPSEASFEETLKAIPKRLNVLRFNIFEKNDTTNQIGDVYFATFKDGSDNETAMVNTSVLNDHRHKGVGLQLLHKISELAKEHNKKRLIFQSTEEDGIHTIEHFNATKISEQEQFRLNLSETNWDIVKAWVEETRPLLAKTQIEWIKVVDSIPEEILEQYSRIMATAFDEHPKWKVNTKAPKEMPIESLKHDIKQFNAKGGKWYLGLLREKYGDISGLTELKWSPSRPQVILQFITHIKLKYRGSGKGKLLKAHTMQYIKENFPEAKYLHTGFVGNENSPLFKINEKIGFKLFYHSATYEIKTTDLDNWVAEHLKMH